MQAVKETAANIAASALSGMEKTKAVLDEKVEKISTSDPVEKDMATLRKEDRIRMAELRKQEAYNQNAAAAANHAGGPGSPTFTASGHINPQNNPFHKPGGEAKDSSKPGSVQQGLGATGTSTVQLAKAASG